MLGAADQSRHWLERFEASIETEAHVSAATIQAYKLDVVNLSRWAVKRRKELIELTTVDLNSYLDERLRDGTNPATLARRMVSCRRFYAYLVSQQRRSGNPASGVRRLRVIRPKPRMLTDATMTALLAPPREHYDLPADSYRAWRDYSLIYLIFSTDLGVSQIRRLQWSQFDADGLQLQLPGHPGALRQIALAPGPLALLRKVRTKLSRAGFLSEMTTYVFATAAGRPMTRQALWHAIRRWAERAGVEGAVTPTALRLTGLLREKERR